MGSLIPRDAMHVSASQLSAYLTCPERFRLQYVEPHRPSHRSGDLVFGSAIHETLAEFHHGLIGNPVVAVPLEVLLERFEACMQIEEQGEVPVMWQDDDSPARLRAMGRTLLGLYHAKFRPRRVLAVEKAFSIPRFDPSTGRALEEQLVGIADLIEEDDEGHVWITELKTAAKRFDDVRLGFDHQATIYSMARTALGFPEARVRFRVLLKAKAPAIVTYALRREDPHVAETTRVVHQVLRAVDAGIFYPHRGWQCSSCPFRAACGS